MEHIRHAPCMPCVRCHAWCVIKSIKLLKKFEGSTKGLPYDLMKQHAAARPPRRPGVCSNGEVDLYPIAYCKPRSNYCGYGFRPKYGSLDDSCPCTCVKAGKADPSEQHNCMADCMDTVQAANDVCFNTPLDSCTSTNPYGPGKASCGYGVIKAKKNRECPKCRCQVLNGVCGVGRYDDHCTPSQT